MTLLSFVPEFIIHLLLIGGVIGFISSILLELFPLIKTYKIVIQIISVFSIVAGAWGSGANFIKELNEKEIAELKNKVILAEKQSLENNSKVEYVYKDKIQTVKDVQVVVRDKIRDIAVTIDSNCKVSAQAIDQLNAAARNKIERPK